MLLTMPTRTLDYFLMGIVAGVVAGLVLVFLFGITLSALAVGMNNIAEVAKIGS